MPLSRLPFREVWAYDFEFIAPRGERPTPVCLVARELRSRRTMRIWQEDLLRMEFPPYNVGEDSVVVAYYASAEHSCHLALGWPLPVNSLDLFTEYRNLTNGLGHGRGNDLLSALASFNLPSLDSDHKQDMRKLIMDGGPWDQLQRQAILDYCESDVEALDRLLPAMLAEINLPQALLRGRYMKATAHMERLGTPLDTQLLTTLQSNWDVVKSQMIAEIDQSYGVFTGRTFKKGRFIEWLNKNNIAWPHNAAGQLDLRRDTFKDMSLRYEAIAPLRRLRDLLSKTRTLKPAVGRDGRNRCLISPFGTITGRNQPSTRDFVFALPAWLRGLIRPPAGRALAYIDFQQQEFAIAAALSQDERMMEAYRSGDPYLMFAKQAGAAPAIATKQTHKKIRDQFKTASLAVQYGQTAESLALRIGQSPSYARELLEFHRRTYGAFWKWSERLTDQAILTRKIWTVFGWTLHIHDRTKPRTISNFPSQANGAEMLRLACCFAVEAGINVCAPIHDALLIEAGVDEIEFAVQEMQRHMKMASAIVLNGFQLRSDAMIVRSPDSYEDEKRGDMLAKVLTTVNGISRLDSQPDSEWRTARSIPKGRTFCIPRTRG